MDKTKEADVLHFNGVNGTMGKYDLDPINVAEFARIVLNGPGAPPSDELARKYYRAFWEREVLGIADGRDPRKLDQAGWGVLFARDEDPAVIEALRQLLNLRKEQAGNLYREYSGNGIDAGYAPGESKKDFLERIGAESYGPADPRYAPYYFLIVGDPEKIPFRFQYQLDIQYAVGRICFRTVDEYAAYASNVVESETGTARLPKRALFFGPCHDPATLLSANHLVEPLMRQLQDMKPDWSFESLSRQNATRENLSEALNGGDPPSFLFTGSHGMRFAETDPRQLNHQGALLCQDLTMGQENNPINEDRYFSADDIAAGANLLGSITFHFACFSAGTPCRSNFYYCDGGCQIAEKDFVARLPQMLLAKGALAFIGHVERAWGCSISYRNAPWNDNRHLAVFRSTAKRILDGRPVGFAMEYFDQKYGEYAAALADGIEQVQYELPDAPSDDDIIRLWFAVNDSRNYIVIGDPAVRLPTEGAETTEEDKAP